MLLIVLSSLLHWLVSQSIFLIVVSTYNQDGVLASAVAVVTYGFSPVARYSASLLAECWSVLWWG